MTKKPAALVVRWNKDLSITIYCRGKTVHRTTKDRATSLASIEPFLQGWFGEAKRKVRFTYA